jgi:hypothetical protein
MAASAIRLGKVLVAVTVLPRTTACTVRACLEGPPRQVGITSAAGALDVPVGGVGAGVAG